MDSEAGTGHCVYRFAIQALSISCFDCWLDSYWGGNSPEEAMAELSSNFERAKAKKLEEGEHLPRPGTTVPIEYASQDRVNLNAGLAQDFIRKVLELEWAWISDESSLWDFHMEETNDRLNSKILEVYGVGVSDIESGNLSEIFERIASKERSLG